MLQPAQHLLLAVAAYEGTAALPLLGPNRIPHPTNLRPIQIGKVKHHHLVQTLPQPRRRQKQRLLRTNTPITTEIVTIDPHETLPQLAHVKIRIGDRCNMNVPR